MESKNELIAKFMGGYLDEETRSWQNLPQKVKHYSLFTHELKYDTSWDWLMPVVEKIDSLKNTSFEMYPAYSGVGNRIGVGVKIQTIRKDFDVLVLPNGRSRIEVVYAAVVEFIEWHNTLPSPPTEQQD